MCTGGYKVIQHPRLWLCSLRNGTQPPVPPLSMTWEQDCLHIQTAPVTKHDSLCNILVTGLSLGCKWLATATESDSWTGTAA